MKVRRMEGLGWIFTRAICNWAMHGIHSLFPKNTARQTTYSDLQRQVSALALWGMLNMSRYKSLSKPTAVAVDNVWLHDVVVHHFLSRNRYPSRWYTRLIKLSGASKVLPNLQELSRSSLVWSFGLTSKILTMSMLYPVRTSCLDGLGQLSVEFAFSIAHPYTIFSLTGC